MNLTIGIVIGVVIGIVALAIWFVKQFKNPFNF